MSSSRKPSTRTLLIIISAIILFTGPTYVIYFLNRFHVSLILLDLLGLILLSVGIVALMRFLKKEETGSRAT